MAALCILLLMSLAATVLGQINLSMLNINPNTVTLSGISSGAAFASQYHVIYSSEIAGVATFAGVVYRCAEGISGTALVCMSTPSFTAVSSHIIEANSAANDGEIDPTTGMSLDKVYIFQGTEDSVVSKGNGPNIEQFYNSFNADIQTQYNIAAEHCQPTDFYGAACNHKGDEYINNCGYNGAYEALNFMLGGGLVKPDNTNTPVPGLYSQFFQNEFFGGDAQAASLDSLGYIYVPSGCDSSTVCHLHVVFHGCDQGREILEDTFVTKTGYREVAELNNIIMIFPQIVKKSVGNPQGCWDWWGYTGGGLYAYSKNTGVQPIGIRKMIRKLVYGE